MSTFTPIFATFTEEDIAAIDRERDRESKRKKRATRARRGVILPDREPAKTHRTLVNPLGPNGASAAAAPAEQTAPVPTFTTSRRAAAIAAQANINLLAQDERLPAPASPPPMPSPIIRVRQRQNLRHSRGLSHQSPTPQVEDTADVGTPVTATIGAGGKRAFREDSLADSAGVDSPGPRKRLHPDNRADLDLSGLDGGVNGYGDVKLEPADVDIEFARRTSLASIEERPGSSGGTGGAFGSGAWHCKNCGMPEHLSGGARKDPQGRKTLCGTCARYSQRTGKPRPVEFTLDERVHIERLATNKKGNGTFKNGSEGSAEPESPVSAHLTIHAQTPQSPLTPLGGDSLNKSESDQSDSKSSSSSGSDSDSEDDFAPQKKRATPGSGSTTIRLPARSGASATPAPGAGGPAAGSGSGSGAGGAKTQATPTSAKKEVPPEWTARVLADTRRKFPKDDFDVIQKARPADQPQAPAEWRVKCMDW